MAEGNGAIYNKFKERVLSGELNLSSSGDTITVALMTAHTPDIDTHEDWGDVSGDEISDSSYSAQTLGTQTVTMDSGNDRAVFDGANTTFSSLDAGTPSHVVMYDDTPSAGYLIAYWELGTTASNGGDYTLAWHSDGIILLT